MKGKLLITAVMLTFSVSVFAINSTVEIKGGIQYPTEVEKTGFDSAATLNIGVDKYFTLGAESGFGWLKWEEKSGATILGNVPVQSKTTTNLYTLPLLAVARIRLADMMSDYNFMPYITGGIGYSWTWYNLPEKTYRFDGLTYQAMVGAEIKLGADSNLSLIAEAGYKGASLSGDNDLELDMSGYVARVGISFPIEPTE